MTTDRDRALLLEIARDAINAHVTGSRPPSAVGGQQSTAVERTALDDRRGGVFVTIHHRSQLRGCIGHVEPDDSVRRLVSQCAVAACSADPRFPPVVPAELPDIQIELSLLGPLEPMGGPTEIEVGRHGVVVEAGRHRGLLLPQVATEWRWDARMLLSQTCRKAGLPADTWQHGAMVKLWRFEAEMFADSIERTAG